MKPASTWIGESARPPFESEWFRTGAIVLVGIVAIVAAYAPTFASVASIWLRSETYMHGALIAPIVAFLIWRKRDHWRAIPPRPSALGGAFLVGLFVVWVAASAGNVLLVRQGAALAMLPALVWALAGTAVVKVLRFPLAYLAFALPMGESLVPPMQDFTATFVVGTLNLMGVPVFVEGRYFSVPAGNFEVAEACSGVRYLIASLALGTLYAYLTFRTFTRQAAFIGLAILLPIIANGVRAFGIVMIASLSDMRLAVGVDHVIYGWIFFGFVVFLLCWLGRFLEEREPAPALAPRTGAVVPERSSRQTHLAGIVVVCFAVLAAGPTAEALWAVADRRIAEVRLELDPMSGDWDGPSDQFASRWHPDYPRAIAETQAAYTSALGNTVDVYAAYYANQSQGAELINSENRLFDSDRWHRIRERSVKLSGVSIDAFAVHEIEIAQSGERRLVWYWYQIGEVFTARPIAAKALEVARRLSGQPPASAVVALSAEYSDDPDAARRVLESFIAAAFGQRPTGMDVYAIDVTVGVVVRSHAEP